MFFFIDSPGTPEISGYTDGEILVSGEEISLTCKAKSGNPRSFITWNRENNVSYDTSSSIQESGYVVSVLNISLSREEDGALIECNVANDLTELPFSANVSLRVSCKCYIILCCII